MQLLEAHSHPSSKLLVGFYQVGSCKLDSCWSLRGVNGEQDGEPRWWEMWADLLNHWWWLWPLCVCGDCPHCFSMEFAWTGGLLQEGWLWGEVWGQAVVQVMRAGWEAWIRHGGRLGQSPGESQEFPDPDNGRAVTSFRLGLVCQYQECTLAQAQSQPCSLSSSRCESQGDLPLLSLPSSGPCRAGNAFGV